MKIAYLLGSLNRGGTETLLLDVFKNADKADFVFIGIHRKGGLLKDEFYKTNIPLYHLYPRFLFDVFYFFKLRKILKKEKVTIVHAQQCLDAFYALLVCWGTGIKVIQTFHGYDKLYAEKKSKLLAFTVKRTECNIFVSYSQKKYYVDKYKLDENRQKVVYNGISFDKIDKAKKIENEIKKMDKLLLGSVGNFVAVRDQMTICRFLALLKQANVDFDFIFVGAKSNSEPYLYEKCVDYCTEKGLINQVHFGGTRDDVPAVLKRLDAFIYSSDHDTFGIAVIEAIASELPVFVNDWDVMCEITDNGKLAEIYKTKNAKDLFDLFLLFIENREEYKERAIENAKLIRKKFGIENHLQKLTEVYSVL